VTENDAADLVHLHQYTISIQCHSFVSIWI